MYKQHLLHNMEREIELLLRLAAIIEEKDLQFSPGEKVRTTHELMQYLSGVGSTILRWTVKNDLGPEDRAALREHNSQVTIQDFPQRLNEQLQVIRQEMAEVTEEDLLTKEIEMPWKEKLPMGAGIMNTAVKFMATYRMQLFLNLKLNGRPELGTREAWVLNAPAAV